MENPSSVPGKGNAENGERKLDLISGVAKPFLWDLLLFSELVVCNEKPGIC